MILRKSLTALIVDPELSTRLRLKEVLSGLALKVQVVQLRSHNDIPEHFSEEKFYDVIFIRSCSDKESINNTIDTIMSLQLSKSPVVILMVQVQHTASKYITEYYLKGVHGFICEPYNVTELESVYKLAENNQRQCDKCQIKRSKKASKLLIKEAFMALDQAAIERVKSSRRGGGFGLKKMRSITPSIQNLSEHIDENELENIIDKELEIRLKNLDLNKFKKKSKKRAKADHPGKILSEIITQRNLKIDLLAEKLQLAAGLLEQIIDEQLDITKEISKSLARIIGNTEDYWNGLQREHDAWKKSQLNP